MSGDFDEENQEASRKGGDKQEKQAAEIGEGNVFLHFRLHWIQITLNPGAVPQYYDLFYNSNQSAAFWKSEYLRMLQATRQTSS